MRVLILLILSLIAALPAFAREDNVSSPLPFQIDSAREGNQAAGQSLSRLVDSANTTGVPVGLWLDFDFGKTVTLTRMTIVNGFAEPGTFRRHSRVKTAELAFSDGTAQLVHLKDTDKPQTIAIRGGGKTVRFTVASVYPGDTSQAPYISRIGFEGFDPTERQVTLTGRFEGCVRSRSSASWEGQQESLFYCSRFRADDGSIYGCLDDLCFHPQNLVNTRLRVTGVVNRDNVLRVLEAKPIN
jgi:hypothetical protein